MSTACMHDDASCAQREPVVIVLALLILYKICVLYKMSLLSG